VKLASIALGLLVFCSSIRAADPPAMPAPQKEHEWLNQLVGEWETDGEANLGPGQPPMKCHGSIQSKSLGGFWVVSEVKSEMMGTPVIAFQTLGYDPKAKKYVGTWVDSMAGHMWKYEGSVDETGKILTLEAEGPNFFGDASKMTKFRDVYEIKSPDHVVSSGLVLGDDGKWVKFMSGNARKKATPPERPL
jgi:hypothetical protein